MFLTNSVSRTVRLALRTATDEAPLPPSFSQKYESSIVSGTTPSSKRSMLLPTAAPPCREGSGRGVGVDTTPADESKQDETAGDR